MRILLCHEILYLYIFYEYKWVPSFSFFLSVSAWFYDLQGKKNPGTDRDSVLSFLSQVKGAKEMKVDRSVSSEDHFYYHLLFLCWLLVVLNVTR